MTMTSSVPLRRLRTGLGAVRRSEIDAARAEILQIARVLVKRGDLLPQSTDDELVE